MPKRPAPPWRHQRGGVHLSCPLSACLSLQLASPSPPSARSFSCVPLRASRSSACISCSRPSHSSSTRCRSDSCRAASSLALRAPASTARSRSSAASALACACAIMRSARPRIAAASSSRTATPFSTSRSRASRSASSSAIASTRRCATSTSARPLSTSAWAAARSTCGRRRGTGRAGLDMIPRPCGGTQLGPLLPRARCRRTGVFIAALVTCAARSRSFRRCSRADSSSRTRSFSASHSERSRCTSRRALDRVSCDGAVRGRRHSRPYTHMERRAPRPPGKQRCPTFAHDHPSPGLPWPPARTPSSTGRAPLRCPAAPS